MADTYSAIVGRVQALLNDVDARVFDSTILLPYVNTAMEDVERELVQHADTEFKKTAVIVIPAGTKSLGPATVPAYPADLMVPIQMRERRDGDTSDFLDMQEVVRIQDGAQQGQLLGVWSWQDDTILFLGATSDVETELYYWRTLSALSAPADALDLHRALGVVAYGAAYYAARARVGATPAVKLLRDEFSYALQGLANIHVRSNQLPAVVPSYRAGRSWSRRR